MTSADDWCFACGETNADHKISGCHCPRHEMSPTSVRDSRKPWAVLVSVANSGQVLPDQTHYFWTRRGARRYADRIGDGSFYRLKVVSNR